MRGGGKFSFEKKLKKKIEEKVWKKTKTVSISEVNVWHCCV